MKTPRYPAQLVNEGRPEGEDCRVSGDERFKGSGFTREGIDRNGFDSYGYADEQFWRVGLNMNPDLAPMNVRTGSRYDEDGYNFYGYDAEEYDRQGFRRYGDDLTGKIDREGYDSNGFFRDSYFRRFTWNRQNIHWATGTCYDPEGFNREGFNADGFNREGYDSNGYNRDGFTVDGRDADGWDARGFNSDAIHRLTGTRYNINGISQHGWSMAGGYCGGTNDLWNHKLGQAVPYETLRSADCLRFANQNIANDKLTKEGKRNLWKEGWRRNGGEGFNTEHAAFVVAEMFHHKDTNTMWNPAGFTVTGINENGDNERGEWLRNAKALLTFTIR